ncbi:hypothetical protein LIER_08469 [Lithospermum erythrorhizon]|uniref:Uncharacterized protein n=1 Tax=Lithospermum erythrorhizon TaxID=34254 RepID=A0AAV3PBY4_LITER
MKALESPPKGLGFGIVSRNPKSGNLSKDKEKGLPGGKKGGSVDPRTRRSLIAPLFEFLNRKANPHGEVEGVHEKRVRGSPRRRGITPPRRYIAPRIMGGRFVKCPKKICEKIRICLSAMMTIDRVPITFPESELVGLELAHDDPLVISPIIANFVGGHGELYRYLIRASLRPNRPPSQTLETSVNAPYRVHWL